MKKIDRMRRASSLIIKTSNGKTVLQHRDDREDVNFSGCWGLVGGAAEENETPEECAIRECYEETGWYPEDLTFLFDICDHCCESVFFTKIKSIEMLACSEGQALSEFTEKEMNELVISDYHKKILHKFNSFNKSYEANE